LALLEIFMEMLSRCFPVEKFWATIVSVPAGWKQGPSMGEAWPLVATWAARMELVELLADGKRSAFLDPAKPLTAVDKGWYFCRKACTDELRPAGGVGRACVSGPWAVR
jgi:hypothetical protein